MIYSCKDCGDRFPGCHAHCPEYKTEKAEHDKEKAKRDFERQIKRGLKEQRDKAVSKTIRKGRIASRGFFDE